MKILVMGGSYFLGRAFVDMAKDVHELTLINRGNKPIPDESVEQFVSDRHDGEKLRAFFSDRAFDAVVDFCAYEKGDIESLLSFGLKTKQYIFISTCDVYERGSGAALREDSPLELRQFAGQEGAYIAGKVALEQEFFSLCEQGSFQGISLRPAMIYGPNNYACRESIYFNWILQAGQVLHPVDATGQFQLVYVEDVARFILLCLGKQEEAFLSFNLCNPEAYTYESYCDMLEKVFERSFERVEIPVQMVQEKQIMLPFPLLLEESESYDSAAVLSRGFDFTDVALGMKKTLDAYRNIL